VKGFLFWAGVLVYVVGLFQFLSLAKYEEYAALVGKIPAFVRNVALLFFLLLTLIVLPLAWLRGWR